MVYGVKDYWKEGAPRTGPTWYMIVIFVFLILVVVYIICLLVYHPVTAFSIEPLERDGTDFASIIAMNTGSISEDFIDLSVEVTPSSGCRVSNTVEDCGALSGNRIYCEHFKPGRGISIECPLPENGTVYRISMRSKYETIKLEFTCSPDKCHETVSYLYGSFPVVWNYLLIYPGDMIIGLYNSLVSWLWG
jgi:hypothetical protein